MFQIKVLFCKYGAINQETEETVEAIFQHFSKTFGFRDPKNCKMLESINNFRNEKFGDLPFSLVGDANDSTKNNNEVAKHFNNREVLEVVFNSDGTFFERASWKMFNESRWIRDNMNPIVSKQTTSAWKHKQKPKYTIMEPEQYIAHAVVTERLNSAFGKLGEIIPNQDRLFQKVASDSTRK